MRSRRLAAVALAFGSLSCSQLLDLDAFGGGRGGSGGSGTSGPGGGGGSGGSGGAGGSRAEGGGGAVGYAQLVLASRPVAYWRLGETTGTTAMNATTAGDVYDGTYEGNYELQQASLIQGSTDSSVAFATTSPARVRVGPTLQFAGNVAFTIEAWVRPVSPTDAYGGIVDNYDTLTNPTSGYGLYIDHEAHAVITLLPSGAVPVIHRYPHPLSLSRPSHVVARRDSKTLCLIIDGVGACTDEGVELSSHGGTLQLGSALGGRLDEVAIYDVALSDAVIAEHYEAGAR